MRTGLTTSLVMSDAFKFLANWNVNVETQNRYQSKCHNFVKRKSLKNKNKNYYVVRNAGSAHSRYTLKLYLIFRFGLLAKSLQPCMTVTDDDDDADT